MKNQKIIVIALLTVIAGLVIYSFIVKPSQGKVVYVETGILLQQYEGMKQARIEFEAKSKELSAGADSLIAKFEEELKTYEKERKKLSKKERELKEELLHIRQKQIGNYQKGLQKKIREEEQNLTQTHINRINDYLKEYGKENGYQYILGANGSGNVVYAKEGLDITQKVLNGLNESYKKEH